MKNILAILAIAACIQLAAHVSAREINPDTLRADTGYINEQDTTKTKRQANPRNKRSSPRDSIKMPPDIRTDTAAVPPTPFDTISNPSRQKI